MPVSQVYLPNSVELLMDVMNLSQVNLNKCLFIPHRAPMTHQVKITNKAWARCYLQKHGWFKAVAFPRSPLQHRWFLPHSLINGVFASVNFSHSIYLCISQDHKLMWSLGRTVYTFEGGANSNFFPEGRSMNLILRVQSLRDNHDWTDEDSTSTSVQRTMFYSIRIVWVQWIIILIIMNNCHCR